MAPDVIHTQSASAFPKLVPVYLNSSRNTASVQNANPKITPGAGSERRTLPGSLLEEKRQSRTEPTLRCQDRGSVMDRSIQKSLKPTI
jgi:hypothetical protein